MNEDFHKHSTMLNQHEIEISYMKQSLEKLVKYSEETAKQLNKISESIAKQEVILEKITNIEDNHKEAVKRLHDRVDNVEGRVNILKKQLDNKPCNRQSVIDNELSHINKQLESHKKIFWTAISALSLGVVSSLLDLIHKG